VLLAGGLVVLGVALVLSGCKGSKKQSQEVAVVDGQSVSAMDVLLASDSQQRSQITLNAIAQILVDREAKRYNIEVTDESIQSQLKSIEERMGGEDQFKKALATRGQQMEDAIVSLKQARVRQLLQVRDVPDPTDDELQTFFKEHQDFFGKPEQYKVRPIIADSRQKAEQAASKLKSGEDFASVSKAFSTTPGQEAQDAQWVPVAQLPEQAQKAIQAVNGKGIAAPYEQKIDATRSGWFVWVVEDHQTADVPTIDSVREEAVLQWKLANDKAEDERTMVTNLILEKKIDVANTNFADVDVTLQKMKTSHATPTGDGMVPGGESGAPAAPQSETGGSAK
jgi:hypothetical protein